MKGWAWLTPAALVLLAVAGWPLGRAIWMSLSVSSATNPDDRTFVGIDSYTAVLTSDDWWMRVGISFVFVAAIVAVQLVLGLMFAGAVRLATVAAPVARALLLVPLTLTAFVTAFASREAFTTGFVPTWVHDDDPGALMSALAIGAGEVWRGTGIVTIIVLVGMSRYPASLLAAAAADGATAWQRFRRVLLPAAGPALAVAATYRVLDTLRMVEGPLLADGPGQDVRTATSLLFDTAFSRFELGLAATMSIVLLVICLLVAMLLKPLLRVRRVV